MKKLISILFMFTILTSSIFADETFKCRKATYIFDDYNGGTYSLEFFFINNFIVYPYNFAGRKNILFVKYEEDNFTFYYAFGQYYPTYLGNGHFSEAANGVGDPPNVKGKKIEEVKYSKTDFYCILADEFYRWYLKKEAFDNSLSSDFECLQEFIRIIKIFSKDDLRILRNTIYAKYGYKFKSKDLNEIFSKTDWYSPKENTEDFEKKFSRLDSTLLEVITLAEKAALATE